MYWDLMYTYVLCTNILCNMHSLFFNNYIGIETLLRNFVCSKKYCTYHNFHQKLNSCYLLAGWVLITINQPFDYMVRGFMILMQGLDITRAIGRVAVKVEPVLGPEIARATASAIWAQNRRTFQRNPSNGPSNVKALHQNHKAKRLTKKQVDWYFYANENR